jgi:hypothetical protein
MARIETLKSIGGSEWTTSDGSKHRVYFSISDMLGIEVETYKTGNICYAERNGQKLSNGKAARYTSGKLFVDVADGKIYTQGMDESVKGEAVEELRSRIAEAEEDIAK